MISGVRRVWRIGRSRGIFDGAVSVFMSLESLDQRLWHFSLEGLVFVVVRCS